MLLPAVPLPATKAAGWGTRGHTRGTGSHAPPSSAAIPLRTRSSAPFAPPSSPDRHPPLPPPQARSFAPLPSQPLQPPLSPGSRRARTSLLQSIPIPARETIKRGLALNYRLPGPTHRRVRPSVPPLLTCTSAALSRSTCRRSGVRRPPLAPRGAPGGTPAAPASRPSSRPR